MEDTQEVLENVVVRASLFSKLPKWLRIILIIISIITIVWWAGWLLWKIQELLRMFLHFITVKSHWRIFLCCIAICLVIALICAQFWFNLDPIGKALDQLKDLYNNTIKKLIL